MNPGRELDALIADKIMFVISGRIKFTDETKRYSTDIAAAWDVVEKLTAYSERSFLIEKCGAWLVRFRSPTNGGPSFTPGETAPHAICLAALEAVNETKA